MNKTDYSDLSVFKKNTDMMDTLINELYSFLNDGSAVQIKNSDFMQCHGFAFHGSSQDDKVAEKLYNYYIEKSKEFANYLSGLLKKQGDNNKLLEEYHKAWNDTKLFLRWMKRIFSNLDKFYLKNIDTTIAYAGFKIFKDICFIPHTPRIVDLILKYLNQDREGEDIPRSLIKSCLNHILQTGATKDISVEMNPDKADDTRYFYQTTIEQKFFIDEFQAKLIQETQRYYQRQSQIWLCWSVPEYVKQALLKLKQEEERADNFFPSSKDVIIAVIEECIIVKHHKILASNEHTGVNAMFGKDGKEELSEIFNLFKRASTTLPEITNRFGTYIENEGNLILSDPELEKDPIQFVSKLLGFKKRLDALVSFQFQNHLSFQRRRDISLQQILNKFEKSPGYLASYVDYELKKGMKGNSEEEIESKFNDLKGLIFLLNSRDTFLKIYIKLLSSRLLNASSVSNDAEKMLYNLMQSEWGQTTVSKIKSMLQDIENSKDLNTEYNDFAKKMKIGHEMSVQVLTQGCWPDTQEKRYNVPDELKQAKEAFEKFYSKKYPGKVLTWIASLGDCEMVASFDTKYTFIVSNYQLAILIMLNKRPTVTYEEIKNLLQFTDNELIPNILMLTSKVNLLIKSNPNDKDKIDEREYFSINKDFTSKIKKVICKPLKMAGTRVENNAVEKDVLKEREFMIDAAIIRVMKSRKMLDYQSIQAETKKLITIFVPDPVMIKRRIESLCERDYMKRDDKDK